MSIKFHKSEFASKEEIDFFEDSTESLQYITEEDNDKKCQIKKYADFSPSIVDNFFTFSDKKEIKLKESQNNEYENNNLIKNSEIFFEEENNICNINEGIKKRKLGTILNPKISKHLPTDNLYEIKEKNFSEEYNINDELIYKKKKRPISNCLLLYLNNFYKKVSYHNIYNFNLYNRQITLKDQNYQCYICLKRIDMFLNLPKEPVFWCSYYMRFVCKNCIDDEFSIIPHFIYKKWCFEKFSISKKAKNILKEWYNKPIIIYNKNDKFLNKIPQLNKVIKVKNDINNIFDMMKCPNKFKLIEEIFKDYKYLALKEIIFSMRDLVEINNKTFFQKINKYKDILILHISGECHECLFGGQNCFKCGKEEKIFFYKNDEVFYCKKCNISYHKKCLGVIGHSHSNKYRKFIV